MKMKTKLFVIGLFAIVIALSSCKKDPEKLIVGTWNNSEIQIDPIDSLANYYMQQNLMQIQMYKMMMQGSLKDSAGNIVDSVQMALNQLDSIEKTLNIDTIKANILKSSLGDATFNEDKTFSDVIEGQNFTGSWNIVKDSLILTVENKDYSYHIDDISKDKFTISTTQYLPDSILITYKYIFTKKTDK